MSKNASYSIELRDVSKVYMTPSGAFQALSRITLAIPRGSSAAFVGKSGSGKSTLLNLIAGIDRASSGTLLVERASPHTMNETQLAQWRGRCVGVVFQFFQLLPTLTVAENVMLPIDFARTKRPAEAHRRALELLDRVGIADQADKLPSALSGGQQQRAAIARALANDPPLLMADEPTGNLDSHTTEIVLGLLLGLKREGKTIILVTHEREIASLVDRVVTLSDGQLVNNS